MTRTTATLVSCVLTSALLAAPSPAYAEERLCDPAFEDCRAHLINLIRQESAGIDVAFWFMTDARYTNELIKRHQAGVSIRVIVDTKANSAYPVNADRLDELAAGGIPMRNATSRYLHWKMMLFSGQNVVQFSAANYSPYAFRPQSPYSNYTDEAIYFSDDAAIVNSFRTRFDTLWVDTSRFTNYANISGPLSRHYDTFSIHPDLNFPPVQSYRSRAISRYNAETQAIDVAMFRITDSQHADAMIAAVQRGVPVRLITEPDQYRDPVRLWHSYNVDRMYMAGVQIRDRAHWGSMHQKSVVLRNQRMVIFGSSNWAPESNAAQDEHNYFTKKSWIYDWFVDQFARKWTNSTGIAETKPFAPLAPARPQYVAPANGLTGVGTTGAVLRWRGGYWAHQYDVYFGVSSNPPLLASNLQLGPSEHTNDLQQYALPALQPGTTYYWRIVSRTMADKTADGDVYSFTTAGTAPTDPGGVDPGDGDIVLYASNATVLAGGWTTVSDSSAAGGRRAVHPNAGGAKIATPLANPAHYIELTFDAQGGVPYRVWMRGRAQNDYWGNDSVHIQFSGSVSSSGSAIWRIGTTSSMEWNLEDCSGCGLSAWGWQDNGWGVGVLGPTVRFAATGTQRMRIQTREDGISLDQIVLSPSTYMNAAPGALKNDTTILAATSVGGGGSGGGGGDPDPGDEIVLYAGRATTYAGTWGPASVSGTAEGRAMRNPNAGVPKIVTAIAAPGDYFELTFTAEAGRPYRIWIRGRAESNYWGNDSVHVQFSGSVTSSGSPIWRIGTTSAMAWNLEDCSGCGLSGWGWQDNGWGVGVLGPVIYFANTGTQRLRVQTREDGLTIDQIVLSPDKWIQSAPGALKNDTTILPASGQ